MINMSYCRFHNTLYAMRECLDALRDGEELSAEEKRCAYALFSETMQFLYDQGVLDPNDEYSGEQEDALDEFISDLKVR